MDVRYINPFLQGALEVLHTMADLDLEPEKPFIKRGNKAKGDVSGVIRLDGEAIGSLSVSFGFDLIQKVLANMLGLQVKEVNDDLKDAVGELTNMISGVARRLLSEQGLKLMAGIPVVLCGEGHAIPHVFWGPILAIPLACAHGHVFMEVVIGNSQHMETVKAERLLEKGESYLENREYSLAASSFERALDLDEKDTRAIWGLGRALVAVGEYGKAKIIMRELINNDSILEPSYKYILNNCGIILRRLGMHEEAANLYLHALKVSKEDENLWFNLARARWDGGDRSKAIAAISRCLRTNPSHKEANYFLRNVIKKHR